MFKTTDRLHRGDIVQLSDGRTVLILTSNQALEGGAEILSASVLRKGEKPSHPGDVEVGPHTYACTELQMEESGVFRIDELVRVARSAIARRIGTVTPRIIINTDDYYKANLITHPKLGG